MPWDHGNQSGGRRTAVEHPYRPDKRIAAIRARKGAVDLEYNPEIRITGGRNLIPAGMVEEGIAHSASRSTANPKLARKRALAAPRGCA